MIPSDTHGCHQQVTEFFVNELGKAAPSQPLLQDFISYLNTIYLKPNSTFPPAMWAGCLDGSPQNTTNGCENFHRHFGTGCLTPHPSIYDWLYHVCLSHKRHMIKSKGQNPPNKKSNALHQHLQELYLEYKNENIDAMTFVKLTSLNCLPTSRIMGKTRSKSQVASIKNKYKKIVKGILNKKYIYIFS